MSLPIAKMLRVWENREKENISLTDVIRLMAMILSGIIKCPREEWANMIVVLLGEPGIGKSEVLKNVLINELVKRTGENWRSHLLHVGGRGNEDDTGLPDKKEFQGQTVAGWAAPTHVPGAIPWRNDDGTPAGYTVGILDELPSATPQRQDQIRELIDGTVPGAGTPVDPRCVYVGAGNPPEAKHITANIIDDAIERRFLIFAVIPTVEELLQVWSDPKIMPDMMYRFMLMNPGAIKHMSPREWVGTSKFAKHIRDGGGSKSDVLKLFGAQLSHCPDVLATMNVYFQHGDDPHYYPIRGSMLLNGSEKEIQTSLKIMDTWANDNNRNALLGASVNDLQRMLKLASNDSLKGNKTAAKNVYEVLDFLAANKRADMVKSLFEVVHSTPLCTPVSAKLKKSPHLREMDMAHKRAKLTVKDINAAVGG